MAAELKFTKFDKTPWGFRLAGGKDYDLPLTVVKVHEDSLAEKIGLTEGDTVIKIDDSCTSQMTHEEAHDVITNAGNNFVMAIIRAQGKLIPNGHCTDQQMDSVICQDILPVDQDICPIITEVPYPQIENEPIDRALTASPYFNPSKTYRPFSTEPIEGVPPIENPIILDPNYNDDFSHIKKLDFEPETIFKLEKVNHKTDSKLLTAGKIYLEETRNQLKDEVGNLDSNLDLDAIEISAKEIVADSISKAVLVTEEIKKEIEIELSKSTTEVVAITNMETTGKLNDLSINISDANEMLDALVNNQEFASPEEKQMWIMTAEYDSKIAELIASRKASLQSDENIVSNVEEKNESQKFISAMSEVLIEELAQNSQEVRENSSIQASNGSQTNESIISENKSLSLIDESKISVAQEIKVETKREEKCEQLLYTVSDNVENIVITALTEVSKTENISNLTENSVSDISLMEKNNQSTQLLEVNQIAEQSDIVQLNQVESNFVSSAAQEVSNINRDISAESNINETKKNINNLRNQFEDSQVSLQEVKRQTIIAANTITEETKYSTNHRQIPAIAPIPSQHYSDQLLKTFFVHLTDVMIALSRMIIAESGMTYGSRSVSPMPPLKRDSQNMKVTEEVATQTQTSQVKSTNQSSAVSFQDSTKSDVCGRIIASNEEVEQLVESIEHTRKLAESVQQTRKLSITAQQSQMLAESAEQLRRLSITAEQTIKHDLAEHSETALKKLSDEITHVSDMAISESSVSDSYEKSILNEETLDLELVIDKSNSLDSHNVIIVEQNESSSTEEAILISEQKLEATEERVDLQQEHVEQTVSSNIQEIIQTSQNQVKEQTVNLMQKSVEVIQQINETRTEEFEQTTLSEIVNTSEQQKIESSTEITESTKQDLVLEKNEKDSENAKSRNLLEPLEIPSNEKVLLRSESDSSDSSIVVGPPTPLTDEYIFRLDIHVKGLRSRTTSPQRPKPAQETPPEHVPKKPRLTANITTEIETSDMATNSPIQINNESTIDDLRKEDERAIDIPADAISLQLPGELVTAIKANESNQRGENQTVLAEKRDELVLLSTDKLEKSNGLHTNAEQLVEQRSMEEAANETQTVDEMELAGFKRVELVVKTKEESVGQYAEITSTAINRKDDFEKPGMTDDDIAVLISGEAEVLKDAHVLGLQRVIASHMNRVKDDDEEDDPDRVNFKKILPQCSFIKDSEVFKALNEEAVKTKEEKKKEDRKWTTFLQTPDRPVPRRKGMFYESPPVEKYQVKIVKQAKPRVAPDFSKSFETGLLPWEERLLNQPPLPPVEQELPILIPEEEPEYLEALDNLPESAVPDLEDTGFALPPEPQPIEDQESQEEILANQADVEDNQGGDTDSCLDQTTESNLEFLENMVSESDPNLTVEEQLAQVQAQLLALSQLPAAIQQTLEIVTQQLSKIVQPKAIKQPEEVVSTEVTDDQITDVEHGLTTDEERLDETEQVTISEVVEDGPQDVPIVEQPTIPQVDPEEVERLRKVEEEKVCEQRKIDKQKKDLMTELQLEHHQRQVKQRATPRVSSPKPAFGPLAPSQRPIFLPGGRKWRNPKDAYNDAFIAETLTKQAEIIQGKTLGVNFMKYEKPPISLDHLKDSDVYKMVHDMDTKPLRAIEKVSIIPIAEEDFREKCRSVTPTTALERQNICEDHAVLPEQVQL